MLWYSQEVSQPIVLNFFKKPTSWCLNEMPGHQNNLISEGNYGLHKEMNKGLENNTKQLSQVLSF